MFSEKYKYIAEQPIQVESMSHQLKQRIWNLFYVQDIQSGGLASERLGHTLRGDPQIEDLILDKMGYDITKEEKNLDKLKRELLQFFQWYEVYDFIEIHISLLSDEKKSERIKQYNDLLKEEKAGYRIINDEIVPLTNETEIQSIETTIQSPYESVRIHISKALELYADRKNPDYENSIKESISAVEAMCCIITGLTGGGATLGATVKKLKDKGVHIHKAMENAFSSLYGYTSDENGIRHGGIDYTSAPAEDAKYMLISCSAFVNYLIEKWNKAKESQET